MVGTSTRDGLNADSMAILHSTRFRAQNESSSRRGEIRQSRNRQILVLERRIIEQDLRRLTRSSTVHPAYRVYWTYFFHDRENPRLVVIVPVRTNTEVHLLWEFILLVRRSQLENAAYWQSHHAVSAKL